ncbi:spaetzle-processing enzyme-like [Schistocerca americana]|uniref:spaetzle-processing enzyme-like n=1 Tax=Schistocerca americana TaxID=7009 RepID=UPI001F4F3393|nr:spaetzle-processing enzyme-like [Schistocerca americana]
MVTTIISPYLLVTLLILKADPGCAMVAKEARAAPASERPPDPEQHPSWRLLEHARCGLSAADRIIGGKNAALGAYPWIARIGYISTPSPLASKYQLPGTRRKAVFRCGAALISSYYVVSAAHCVANLPGGLEVGLIRLGEHNTRTDPDCEDGVCAEPVQDFRPSEVLMHADYDQLPFKHDISLIRLDRAVRFHDFVMPICMIHGKLLTKNYVGEPTEVAGWGVFDIEDPRPSPILQTITLRVVSNAECAPRFEMYAEVGPTQMCVGGVVGQDSCGGDSGGPLMKVEALDGPPRYYLLGVVSFGSKRCGASTMPGVYTRMADYVHWVLDNMHE